MKVFAERLRKLQKDRDMTQVDFAKLLDIAPGTLANYMNDRKNPQIDTVASIAEKLGVTVGWLCGDDVEVKRPETYIEVVKAIDWLLSLNDAAGYDISLDTRQYTTITIRDEKLQTYYMRVQQLEAMTDLDKELKSTVIDALKRDTFNNVPLPDTTGLPF